MRVEFRQGVPEGCIDWLWDTVGRGNLGPGTSVRSIQKENDNWFYERVWISDKSESGIDGSYVPAITVKDSKLALLFILRWS